MRLNRVAELVIGPPSRSVAIIRDLRFTFEIHKDNDKSTNQLKLTIFNLNAETRWLVEHVNNMVILKAGYGTLANALVLFTGTVTRSQTTKQGNDIITELSVSDGILPLRKCKIALSYAANSSAMAILKDIAHSFGLTVRHLPKQLIDKNYPRGYAFCGKTETAMSEVCDYLGATWSIQNHTIQILMKEHPIEDELIVLTPENGLIGIPTRIVDATRNQAQGDKSDALILSEREHSSTNLYQIDGYHVQSLLQPTLYPGCYVGLESNVLLLDPKNKKIGQARPRQFFRAEVVEHIGDTQQGDWLTKCELKPLGGAHGRK